MIEWTTMSFIFKGTLIGVKSTLKFLNNQADLESIVNIKMCVFYNL